MIVSAQLLNNKDYMILSNNLAEDSVSYNNEAEIYKIFSQAEDYPNKIFEQLLPLIKDKKIIDIGCGNGKYCSLLSAYVKNIIAIDKSIEQLKLAYANNTASNISFLQADATHIPLSDNSTDVVFSSWMLGTITDPLRQLEALTEMKRVCKKEGFIILIENSLDSEFEILRGRYSKIDNRTATYNNWLISQGFKVHSKIDTFFKFKDQITAQHVFSSIWKSRLTKNIEKDMIEHKVDIYIYQKL